VLVHAIEKKTNTDLLLILKIWLEAYVVTYFQLKKLMELVILYVYKNMNFLLLLSYLSYLLVTISAVLLIIIDKINIRKNTTIDKKNSDYIFNFVKKKKKMEITFIINSIIIILS
jgi:hypothetical protein